MKTICVRLFFVVMLITALSVLVYAGDKEKVRSEIQKLNDQMKTSLEQGNPDAMLSLYTDDAINLPAYSKMNKGISEIRAHFNAEKENMPKFSNVKFETVEVLGEDDLFVEIGKYEMTLEMKNSDKPMTDVGKYITVWKEQPDGSLKIVADTWNTDVNYMQMAEEKDTKDMDKEMMGGEKDTK